MPAAGLCWLLLGVVLAFGVAASPAQASRNSLLLEQSPAAGYYDFVIKETKVTRLCQEKTILAVNGQFPGPTIYARKGDVVVVNVYNQGSKNITLHWHGVDQPRNPWSDGPEHITQCPIQPGASFSYRILFTEEEGTLWWHAHSDYGRTTVHGVIVIRPKDDGSAYPYPMPDGEVPIILGEWWNADAEQLFLEARRTGGDVKVSDANTINGQPGDYAPCSKNDTFRMSVEHGKTYLLRVINAGLTNHMFFAVAGHRLTVVGTDGHYLKPFTVDYIMIAGGQTMDLLLEANRTTNSSGDNNSRYYMAASPYYTNAGRVRYDDKVTTAILEYTDAPPCSGPPDYPYLPSVRDVAAATSYTAQLRSLASKDHPIDVPMVVDEHMLVTISSTVLPCEANNTCNGPLGGRIVQSLNSISFVPPAIDLLDAYYDSISGVYEPNFSNRPPLLQLTKQGTQVKVVEYGTVVEVVFQDDLTGEGHPMHLHGYSFYVVGQGFGKFNKYMDPAKYNLVDPPYQNTVSVPPNGWVAIRFRATNPGVWFMHCHIDIHMVWGMNTVFIVENGKTSDAQMLPRPPNMPKC
ncbi:hypothetical protein BDA96_05G177900 [Sorghum bicolor]|uniref:Laccase n=1 Tax=Sorghum bicolor TaxID=4558 RepID=A0A921R0T4_SORBI|nr:hypothetical protein BDA96_05G177900 [Sorghum bicolor]